MKPTIGRTVHYMAPLECGGETYAGIITSVAPDDSTVNLVTFGATSVYFNLAIPFSESPQAGSWSWPPRV